LIKRGIVMEGGAMRGMFTCGVTDLLMEEGICFDGAIGVSAGATFGCNIKSNQQGRARRYCKKYSKDKRFGSFSSWRKTGDVYDVDFCYHQLPEVLDPWDYQAFHENPMDFWVVATETESGKACYQKLQGPYEKDLLWITASASMPLASRPVEIEGKKYLDGGISDSIPLKFMEDQGFEKIVVIETQPKGYRKKPQKFFWVIGGFLKKMPAIREAMKERYFVYNKEKEYILSQEKEGKVLVIRPEKALGISRMEHDPLELERVYQEGRQVAKARLKEIKNYLQ